MEAARGGFLSEGNQTLSLAFFLGLIFQAGLASFSLFIKGHVKSLFKEGPRLALVCFLLFGGLLWPQLSFGALLLPKIPSICQGVLIFQVVADQLARCSIEQFLLWRLTEGTKVSLVAFIMQGVLLIRLVAGGVVVGFSRPSFSPTCVVSTSLVPASIVVMSLDVIIIVFLVVRSITFGMVRDIRRKDSPTRKSQSKAFIITTISFILWTLSSSLMVLGLPGFPIIVRMGAPANGLLILILVLTLFGDALLSSREEVKMTLEAQSPHAAPETTSRDVMSGGLDVGSGTPVAANMFGQRKGSLVVVNESPRGSVSPFNSLKTSNRGFVRLDKAPQQRSFATGQDAPMTTPQGGRDRGSSGVFGAIINQAILKSPGQFTPSSERERAVVAKQSLFGWSKSPAKSSVRSLGISKPIMVNDDETEDRPFVRLNTVDLATAQRNESERRQMARAKASPLTFNPVNQRPMATLREDPRELNAMVQESPVNSSSTQAMLVPRLQPVSLQQSATMIGSTTSASLSPSMQDIRRRSPRDMSGFDFDLAERPNANPTSAVPQSRFSGLPSNPRSRKPLSVKPQPSSVPTVMLMNDIIYDSPSVVKSIIKGAGALKDTQRPQTADPSSIISFSVQTSKPEQSVIHRPRPFRRDFEKDRAIFPAEPYTRHKRSRSTGSLLNSQQSNRKPLLASADMPLPAKIPKTAAELKKILPNEHRSMTFDEKVELLFPAPPASNLPKRRSSVPSIPRIPSMFLADIPKLPSPSLETSNRASRRTTIASLAQLSNPRSSSYTTSQSDIRRQTKSSFQDARTEGSKMHDKRVMDAALSESDRKSNSTETVSTDALEVDDGSTYWRSIHSGVPQVDLGKARQNARSTYIKGVSPPGSPEVEDNKLPSRPSDDNLKDTIPVMLDDGTASYCSYVNSSHASQNCLNTATPHAAITFHHRIGGEKPPTFSERAAHLRIRRMHPPPPLTLYTTGRATNIVIRTTEPSPISSPEMIIAEINAQLDRMEAENNRLSYISIQTTGRSPAKNHDRLQLLENLEREMQDIERLQIELNRHSISTTTSSATVSPHPPPKVSLISEMIANRKSKRLSRGSTHGETLKGLKPSISNATSDNPSDQESEQYRTSLWQQQITEARESYAENALSLVMSSRNFIPMLNMQTASPTPPESVKSDSDSEYEVEILLQQPVSQAAKNQETAKLWQQPPSSSGGAFGRLWTYPHAESAVLSSPKLLAKSTRPKQRLTSDLMQISTSSLWTQPLIRNQAQPQTGLWRSKIGSPANLPTLSRPRLSVKPRRKSRPLTLLPDIVESPVPLPDKKETLGIYQFPWGETSDQAIYQPAFTSITPLPHFIPSTALNARSLELEAAEYSSSFFDDYEDESGSEETSFEDSDDEFDDNTLFEIADLLRSDNVPSRQSLFSPSMTERDYSEEIDYQSGSDVDEPQPKASLPPLRLPIPPLELAPKSPSVAEYSSTSGTATSTSLSTRSVLQEAHEQTTMTGNNVFLVQDDNPPVVAVSLLWSAPKPAAPQSPGMRLFVPSKQIESVPAVTVTISKDIPRMPRQKYSTTLAKLESNTLWSMPYTLSLEHDWISESSIRAITPSAYSPSPFSAVTTTELTDDIFDTASIRTASTKASTIWDSMAISTPTWWQSRSESLSMKRNPSSSSSDSRRPTPASPKPVPNIAEREAELNSRIPKMRRQKSMEKCQKIKESNDAARRIAMPEISEVVPPQPKLNFLQNVFRGATSTPDEIKDDSTKEEQTSQISKAESETALNEALKTGTVKTLSVTKPLISKDAWIAELNSKAIIIGPAFVRKTKPIATEAEWVDALNEAILAGTINKPNRPIVSKDHWVSQLEQAVYTFQVAGEVRTENAKLWSCPTLQKNSNSSLLWMKSSTSVEEVAFVPFSGVVTTPMPKSRHVRTSSLVVSLESLDLWKPTTITEKDINWLEHHPSALKRATTWTPRTIRNPHLISVDIKLWSPSTQSHHSSSPIDIFHNTTTNNLRRSAPFINTNNLPTLESNTLFTKPNTQQNTINWLHHSTSASSPSSSSQTHAKSQTWSTPLKPTPPSPTTSNRNTPTLWTPSLNRHISTSLSHFPIPADTEPLSPYAYKTRSTNLHRTINEKEEGEEEGKFDMDKTTMWTPESAKSKGLIKGEEREIERNWLLSHRAWWVGK